MVNNKADNMFDHKTFLENMSNLPGVYDMRDSKGKTLYIGKAKNLRARLSSYFRSSGLTKKTNSLVNKIFDIKIMVTNTETEALLLEQNLIKTKKPPYNVLLRDDKSYPYIFISDGDEFPRIDSCRLNKRKKGKYYGPYPNSLSVRKCLDLLQKIFKIRQCSNTYFKNRTRPCLQYQIKRCKAPCVGRVSKTEYQSDLEDTIKFLEGKSQQLIQSMINKMEIAIEALNFEEAAENRDKINHLRIVQEQQIITKSSGNIDAVGFAEMSEHVCFDVLFVRSGKVIGHRFYFPDFKIESELDDYLENFLAQFYVSFFEQRDLPDEIILPFKLAHAPLIEHAIKFVSGKSIQIKHNVRSERRDWMNLANKNAIQNLESHLQNKNHLASQFLELNQLLGISIPIRRIECFDISHTMGEATVASCVVFGPNGKLSSEYRRYNIIGIEPGDDYAAMSIALDRHYRQQIGTDRDKRILPDIIIIDGGKGQLKKACEIMQQLNQATPLLGIAKGTTRKVGLEKLIYNNQEINPKGYDGALLLLQKIVKEAHRFAISGHRKQRHKSRKRSLLEDIPGIGSKRRSSLLQFFGSRDAISRATVEELKKVEGISLTLAHQIKNHFSVE